MRTMMTMEVNFHNVPIMCAKGTFRKVGVATIHYRVILSLNEGIKDTKMIHPKNLSLQKMMKLKLKVRRMKNILCEDVFIV